MFKPKSTHIDTKTNSKLKSFIKKMNRETGYKNRECIFIDKAINEKIKRDSK